MRGGYFLFRRLVNALAEAAQSMGCYKVVLDCTEAQSEFYTKCGFVQSKRKEKQMVGGWAQYRTFPHAVTR